jgi:hypothetical protein
MGSHLEINDTLQLTTEQGFPVKLLDREKHCKNPVKLESLANRIFKFHDKPSARIFQLDPVRVYYAHNIGERWLFWGRVFIQSLLITKRLDPSGIWKEGDWVTSGTYKIIDIYDPEYQKAFTIHEAPPGKCFFPR